MQIELCPYSFPIIESFLLLHRIKTIAMKKLNVLMLATMLFFTNNLSAQKEITVTSVNKQMSRGMQPGYMVNIPEATVKDVSAAYKKQLEDNTKASAKSIDNELVIYGAVNKNFSANPFIIYSKMLETTDGIELTIYVTEDSLKFIGEDSDPDKVAALKKTLHDFAASQYKMVVNKQLAVENKKLLDLKETLEDQMDDENENLKDIKQNQRNIENYQSKIESNKTQQASKIEQIDKQQKLADGISDKKSPEYNLATKNLKKYQDEKKSLEKESEKYSRSIDDENTEIKELEHKNEDIKKQQATTNQKIEAQDIVVKNMEAVINGIK